MGAPPSHPSYPDGLRCILGVSGTWAMRPMLLPATEQAFAAILRNPDQLSGTRAASERAYAFAAILAEGSVVTWGNARHGGDSSAVQVRLQDVRHIQATSTAFAALATKPLCPGAATAARYKDA